MESKATIPIESIRAAFGVEVSMKRMTKEERDRLEKLLGLDWREEEYGKKDEEHFIDELAQFFDKWDLMINADISPNGRIEYIVGAFQNRCMYHPKGVHCVDSKDIKLLPRINKRRKFFEQIKLNENVHIDDVRPILSAITRVEVGSWNYVTDDEFKQMIEALKEKYNLS